MGISYKLACMDLGCVEFFESLSGRAKDGNDSKIEPIMGGKLWLGGREWLMLLTAMRLGAANWPAIVAAAGLNAG